MLSLAAASLPLARLWRGWCRVAARAPPAPTRAHEPALLCTRVPARSQEEEEEEEEKPAAKKQKGADGGAVDVSAANGSRTIFIKNLAWAADEVRAGGAGQIAAAAAAAAAASAVARRVALMTAQPATVRSCHRLAGPHAGPLGSLSDLLPAPARACLHLPACPPRCDDPRPPGAFLPPLCRRLPDPGPPERTSPSHKHPRPTPRPRTSTLSTTASPAGPPTPRPPQNALSEFFADCGPVAEVRIAYDRDTGRARGFAHVQFEEVEGAAKAILKSGESLLDREVYIESTTERQQREWVQRGAGGQGAGQGDARGVPVWALPAALHGLLPARCTAALRATHCTALAGQPRVSPHALPPPGVPSSRGSCWHIALGNATERAPRSRPPAASRCLPRVSPHRGLHGGAQARGPASRPAQLADSIALGSAVGAVTLWVLPSTRHPPPTPSLPAPCTPATPSALAHLGTSLCCPPDLTRSPAPAPPPPPLPRWRRHSWREPVCGLRGHHHLRQGLRHIPG